MDIGRHASEFGCIGVIGKGIGGVERVFAELLAQLGQALLDGRKAFPLGTNQFCTTEHKVAQGVLVGLALLGRQRARLNLFVLGIEALVRTQAREELGDFGQDQVVGGAQFGRIGNALEVVHRAPGAAQFFNRYVQHTGDGVPLCGKGACRHRFQ